MLFCFLQQGRELKNIAEVADEKQFVKEAFDESGKLKKNVSFIQSEFGYINETDELGRLSKVQTHDLQLSTQDRLPHKGKMPVKIIGDHAWHLFGDRFGGSPQLDNLVSQASNVNLSKFKIIENEWASAIKEGKKVDVEIKINYKHDELRPSSFNVKYTIDGKKFNTFIKN